MQTELSNVLDNVLVENVRKKCCSDSFIELSKRHENLFYNICHIYIRILSSLGVDYNDIYEEKSTILYKSILSFNNKKKTKFSTWFGSQTRYFLLHKINDIKRTPELDNEDVIKQEFEQKSLNDFLHKKPDINLVGVIKHLSNAPDKRAYDVFKLRYSRGLDKKMPWRLIAKKLSLGQQTAQYIHKKGLEFLRKEISRKKVEIFV